MLEGEMKKYKQKETDRRIKEIQEVINFPSKIVINDEDRRFLINSLPVNNIRKIKLLFRESMNEINPLSMCLH